MTQCNVSGLKKIVRCALVMVLTLGVAHANPAQPHTVIQIRPGAATAPLALPAFVFNPQGVGPHPAVVMVHGCGGAYGKDGKLNARHQMWGEYLAAQGFVALMLDSFSARGFRQICAAGLVAWGRRHAECHQPCAGRWADRFQCGGFVLPRLHVAQPEGGQLSPLCTAAPADWRGR